MYDLGMEESRRLTAVLKMLESVLKFSLKLLYTDLGNLSTFVISIPLTANDSCVFSVY